MSRRTLFTIGHSTRPWPEFLRLLQAWQIDEVVDVRTVPRSRAIPWFDGRGLAKALEKAGIRYIHIPHLGGLRHAKKDSPNTAWRNSSFRGYADYMQTDDFAGGLRELDHRQKAHRVCIMCAEAVWWRCHRRMIADAEAARGIPVKHIMSEKKATPHEITEFARVRKKRGHLPTITYPG